MYKVVIPSAGLGSRVGPYTKFINKALITIAGRPAISHVICKFDPSVEIVVLLGYKGDYVRQVIDALHGDRHITYVDVDKFEGPGSGLGYSLLCAEQHLQCPFIFVANDTIVPSDTIDIDPSLENWVGYFKNDGTYDLPQYRTLEIVNNRVTTINPKGVNCENIYIGAAGVKAWDTFWEHMHEPNAIVVGEAYGLQALRSVRAIHIPSWCDTGNMMALEQTKTKFGVPEHNVLEKESEAIWFLNNKVIKFSTDEKFISDRLRRVIEEYLPLRLLPKIIYKDKNLYVYEKVHGKMLSETLDTLIFSKLFYEMNAIWLTDNYSTLANTAIDRIITASMDFYKTKTENRLGSFLKRFEIVDKSEIINGVITPSMRYLLNKIDWAWLTETIVVGGFHGDFHCENIVDTGNGNFVLLDWRQNFGEKNYMLGDVYYDLAKFYHGLIVPHSMIYRGEYEAKRLENGELRVDVNRPNRFVETTAEFESWVAAKGFSMKKIRILAALIYINSSALHEHEYAVFLYYFGRYQLQKVYNEYIDR